MKCTELVSCRSRMRFKLLFYLWVKLYFSPPINDPYYRNILIKQYHAKYNIKCLRFHQEAIGETPGALHSKTLVDWRLIICITINRLLFLFSILVEIMKFEVSDGKFCSHIVDAGSNL